MIFVPDRLAIRGSPRIQGWVRTVSDFSFIARASPHDDFWLDLDYRVGFYDDRRSRRHLFNAYVSVARATVHQVKRVIRCRNRIHRRRQNISFKSLVSGDSLYLDTVRPPVYFRVMFSPTHLTQYNTWKCIIMQRR